MNLSLKYLVVLGESCMRSEVVTDTKVMNKLNKVIARQKNNHRFTYNSEVQSELFLCAYKMHLFEHGMSFRAVRAVQ